MSRMRWPVIACLLVAWPALAEEPLPPGELVETIDPDTALVQCQGRGPDTESAIAQARLGCLRWSAAELLGAGGEARLAEAWPALASRVDAFVGRPGPAGRGGGEGIRSRSSEDGAVRVVLNTRVYTGALRRHLEEAGLLAAAPPPGARRTVVVLADPDVPRPKLWFLVKAELIPFLMKAGFEVLEEPEAGRAVGADLSLVVSVQRTSQEQKGVEAFSYVVALKAVETGSGRVLAAGSVQGRLRPAWKAEEEARGLCDAVADAAGSVLRPLEVEARRGAGGAGK